MNFVTNNISDQDTELFFGPIEDDDIFIIIEPHWIMAHILHAADIFPSISQARKNGWNKPIPKGFTMLTVGKKAKKKDIFIFFDKKSLTVDLK
jgi:hypothetical protein